MLLRALINLVNPQRSTRYHIRGWCKREGIGKKRLETVFSKVPLKTYSWPRPSKAEAVRKSRSLFWIRSLVPERHESTSNKSNKAKLCNCSHTERPPVSCDETSESHIMAVWDYSLKWAVVVPSSRYYGLRLQTTSIFERQIHQTFWEAYIDYRCTRFHKATISNSADLFSTDVSQ